MASGEDRELPPPTTRDRQTPNEAPPQTGEAYSVLAEIPGSLAGWAFVFVRSIRGPTRRSALRAALGRLPREIGRGCEDQKTRRLNLTQFHYNLLGKDSSGWR